MARERARAERRSKQAARGVRVPHALQEGVFVQRAVFGRQRARDPGPQRTARGARGAVEEVALRRRAAKGRCRPHPLNSRPAMFRVTREIEFCYGHRLLDYDGVCKHPHGHNAVVEVEVRTDRLDNRNMVADFSDIKRIVKGWIDRELDHKMILRHDDPLVAPLQKLGEPIYILESNPTVERIAKLIFDEGRKLGINIITIRVWETPSSFASYTGE
mgnify:CR=1 FL=1